MENLGHIGIAATIALAAVGSALGSGAAGMGAIGGWKKAFSQNKPATFILIVFVGAPLTQTIYGMILMGVVKDIQSAAMQLGTGVFGGLAMGFSAWMQGKAGAAGADALAETGKGFTNYLIVVGLIETVALFVMVFLLSVVGGM